MNYQRIYDQIIDRARTRILEGYVERHHIIPRSLGGNNSKENIVRLTAKEHLVCHICLARIYGGKMWAALNRMTNFGEKNSKKYEIYRKQYAKSISGTGNPRSGVIMSQELKDKIGRGNTGKKQTKEHIEKVRAKTSGITRSSDAKLNYAKSKGGGFKFKAYRLVGYVRGTKKEILEFDLEFVGEFQTFRECERTIGVGRGDISKILSNRKRQAKGFTFKRSE